MPCFPTSTLRISPASLSSPMYRAYADADGEAPAVVVDDEEEDAPAAVAEDDEGAKEPEIDV